MEIKYTLLPPQKAPTMLSSYRRPGSLGEHQAAFLNSNNRFGFQVDEIPEEPVVEELAALFLTVVKNLPKITQADQYRLDAIHRRKMKNAGYTLLDGAFVEIKTLTPEQLEKLNPVKEVKSTPLNPQEVYYRDKDKPEWKKPWEHVAYHEAISRKHIAATRVTTHYHVTSNPLNDMQLSHAEYLARRELLSKIQDTLNENQVLQSVLPHGRDADSEIFSSKPKSDPTGSHRINPYLK